MLRRMLPLLGVVAVSLACGNARGDDIARAFEGYRGNYVITVEKRTFTLRVHDRSGGIAAEYRVAYGLNPDRSTKLYAGDNRTPEGMYRITEMLSMDAQPGSAAYRKLLAMNRIFFRARDGHYKYGRPEVDLAITPTVRGFSCWTTLSRAIAHGTTRRCRRGRSPGTRRIRTDRARYRHTRQQRRGVDRTPGDERLRADVQPRYCGARKVCDDRHAGNNLRQLRIKGLTYCMGCYSVKAVFERGARNDKAYFMSRNGSRSAPK
jgi:hypothetical protein